MKLASVPASDPPRLDHPRGRRRHGAPRALAGTDAQRAVRRGRVVGALCRRELAPHCSPKARSRRTRRSSRCSAPPSARSLEVIASSVGVAIKQRLRASPLRLVDAAGGSPSAVVIGLAVVWILAAVALQSARTGRAAEGRAALGGRPQELNELVPPRDVLNALARVDPFPSITGPLPAVDPPDRQIGRDPEGPHRTVERRPHPGNGVRARDLRVRLGRGPEPRRDQRARGRRSDGHDCGRQVAQSLSPSTRATTSRSCGSTD